MEVSVFSLSKIKKKEYYSLFFCFILLNLLFSSRF
jgi:hypothetical protein